VTFSPNSGRAYRRNQDDTLDCSLGVSKSLEGNTQNTQNVAALKRDRDQDLAINLDKISNTLSSTTGNRPENVLL